MRREFAAVYIMAQITCAQAEMQGMVAANQARAHREESPAYEEQDFTNLITKYNLDHNAVIGFLAQASD